MTKRITRLHPKKFISIYWGIFIVFSILVLLFLTSTVINTSFKIDSKAAERCTPGQTKCVGQYAYSCYKPGVAWSYRKCSDSQTCSNGTCVAKTVCTPGQTKCVGQYAYSCYKPGVAWSYRKCSDSQTCSNGNCVSK